eukprot:jgi/Botrbrau1/18910/Bobra.177_2s0067.1
MASRAGGQREARAGGKWGLQDSGPLLEEDANGLHSDAHINPGRVVGKLVKLDMSGMSHSKSRKLDLAGTSPSKSLKLGQQARGSKGIGKLPGELLANILGGLDPRMLMAARLVCRAFRAASIPCVTALRYQSPYARDPSSVRDLTSRLQVFTSVGSLDLDINLFPISNFFEAPRVLSLLRRLRLSWRKMEICDDEVRHLATSVAAATQLTALEISGELCKVEGFGILLAQSLEACSALRDLRLEICDVHPPLDIDVWEGFRGKSAPLSRLEAVGTVILYSKEHFEDLAALTQLMRLSLDVRSRETLHLTLLSSLTALQSLHVACSTWHDWRWRTPPIMHHVYQLVERMPRLQELDLDFDIWDGDVARTASLVAFLPAMTSFTSHSAACPAIVPNSFFPVGLSRLRKLSILLELYSREDDERLSSSALINRPTPLPLGGLEHATSFSAAMAGLETLELSCGRKTCHMLFCHLTPMECLTRLRIHVHDYRESEAPTMCTPGCFLTGLPKLRHLELVNVLDVRRWHDDARYLAGLTGLTELEISLFRRELMEDMSGLTLAKMQPLTTLTQLNFLFTSEPWASGMACPEFQQALNRPRHQMGLPPVRFTEMDILYTGVVLES